MQAAIAKIKPAIDTGVPRTEGRWRGRNFNTTARRTAERAAEKASEKSMDAALARAEATAYAPHERRKDKNDADANPPLLQRRTRDRQGLEAPAEFRAAPGTVALTVAETLDARLWSNMPPWRAGASDHAARPSGGVRPGNVALRAEQALAGATPTRRPRERAADAAARCAGARGPRPAEHFGGALDLEAQLGMGPAPLGILLGLHAAGGGGGGEREGDGDGGGGTPRGRGGALRAETPRSERAREERRARADARLPASRSRSGSRSRSRATRRRKQRSHHRSESPAARAARPDSGAALARARSASPGVRGGAAPGGGGATDGLPEEYLVVKDKVWTTPPFSPY